MNEATSAETSYSFAPTSRPAASAVAAGTTVQLRVDIPAGLHAHLLDLEKLDLLSLTQMVETALAQYAAAKEGSPLIMAARARAAKTAEQRETISGRIPSRTRSRARQHASHQGIELQQLLDTALTEYLDRHEG